MVFVWWFVTRKLKGLGRRQRPKPVEPKYQSLVFGNYLEKEVHPCPSPFEDKWNVLAKLLAEDSQFTVLNHLISSVPVTEHDELSRNVVFFFEHQGKSQELFTILIQNELKGSDSEGSVFRANSFPTKMFRIYSKMHGLKYLFSVLSVALLELKNQIEQENVTLEVDPNKIEEGEDSISNRWQLLLIAQKLFTAIVRSASNLPSPLRNIAHIVKQEVSSKFPNLINKSLSSFIFLRFYCPAIIAPQGKSSRISEMICVLIFIN